jgi:chorismate synthase
LTGNIFGDNYVIVSFGESHGKVVGVVIDGCPAGLAIDEEFVQKELDLRKPGQSKLSSPRAEEDKVKIMSGVFNGYSTGAPLCMLVNNKNIDSKPYETIKHIPRPGHADFPARIKYGGYNDYRGGGRFSARRTISYLMGGSVAKKLLKTTLNIRIKAYTIEIGGISADTKSRNEIDEHCCDNEVRCPDPDASKRMIKKILEAKKQGNSLGGIIECIAQNVPVGLGDPCFSSLDSDLSKALISIPGAKGIEFGSGFNGAKSKGSENNDLYYLDKDKVKTRSNNSGGIIGGLSTGMPIVLRVAFKPVSSISKSQQTLDVDTGKEVNLEVPGRHDPCVVPRAVPIVESMVALVLTDHSIKAQLIPKVLKV